MTVASLLSRAWRIYTREDPVFARDETTIFQKALYRTVTPTPSSGARGGDPDGARVVDLALRAAAAGSPATGLPPLRWVEVAGDEVLLVFRSPAPPPRGFTSAGANRWLARGSAEGLAEIAGRTEMPAPTLVPVGTTPDDGELLVELDAGGVVSVVADPGQTLELLRAIAVGAATTPWSEAARVLLVGMHGELTELPWVSPVPRLAEAIGAVEDHIDVIAGAPEPRQALMVISVSSAGDQDEYERVAALTERRGMAVAVVMPSAPATARSIPLGRTFTITSDGWLHIDGVEPRVRPHRLRDADANLVRLTPVDPVPIRRMSPNPFVRIATTNDASSADAKAQSVQRLRALLDGIEVVVRVLGDVEAVRRPDRFDDEVGELPEEQRLVPVRAKSLEAIAYLALQESSVAREELEIQLFPDGANAAKTLYNVISAARALVGEDLFPPSGSGHYRLSDRVATDYGVFCNLVSQAAETEDTSLASALLADALSQVRGEPFTGAGRGYAWATARRGTIVAQVVDAAEELAEMYLSGRPDRPAAEWAARQGLRAFPTDERMYRLLMRAAHATGDVPGVRRVFRELCDVVTSGDPGIDAEDTLHPETVVLFEELTGASPGHRPREWPGAGHP